MSILPIPEIPYYVVHTNDIVLLLTFGFFYELVARLYQHKNQRRTSHERKINIQLHTLRYEAAKKRALGPAAFVEASKLERAVLATEKELTKLVEERDARTARAMRFVKSLNWASNIIILMAYWGVPMLAVDGSRVNFIGVNEDIVSGSYEAYEEEMTDFERAAAFWKGLLFPLSYNMLGFKVSQFGIENDAKPSCLGALVVVWAARTTCGEIVDCALIWWGR